jgi:hypothetical protein
LSPEAADDPERIAAFIAADKPLDAQDTIK